MFFWDCKFTHEHVQLENKNMKVNMGNYNGFYYSVGSVPVDRFISSLIDRRSRTVY